MGRDLTRRDFAGLMAALGCAGAFGGSTEVQDGSVRAVLLHLGQNMWGEYREPGEEKMPGLQYTADHLRTDEAVWRALTERMRTRRFNMAVIDIGEGLVYPSHPELAVKGSWSAEKLAAEVKRLKGMGIEAVPKLNFSTCHDGWLKEYGRMISTAKYRDVVKDLIDDVCEVFGNPRLFHLGLDEECSWLQSRHSVLIVRRGGAFWQDFNHYLKCLDRHGARPIAFGPSHEDREKWTEEFYRRASRETIISNAIYGHGLVYDTLPVWKKRAWDSFEAADKAGFTQLPCASNWVSKENVPKPWPTGKDYPQDPEAIGWFVKFCRERIDPSRLMGFMAAPWGEINSALQFYWENAIDQLADATKGE